MYQKGGEEGGEGKRHQSVGGLSCLYLDFLCSFQRRGACSSGKRPFPSLLPLILAIVPKKRKWTYGDICNVSLWLALLGMPGITLSLALV